MRIFHLRIVRPVALIATTLGLPLVMLGLYCVILFINSYKGAS